MRQIIRKWFTICLLWTTLTIVRCQESGVYLTRKEIQDLVDERVHMRLGFWEQRIAAIEAELTYDGGRRLDNIVKRLNELENGAVRRSYNYLESLITGNIARINEISDQVKGHEDRIGRQEQRNALQQGVKGQKGSKGDPGLGSASAIIGPRGFPGITGPQGFPGRKGDKGQKGQKGSITVKENQENWSHTTTQGSHVRSSTALSPIIQSLKRSSIYSPCPNFLTGNAELTDIIDPRTKLPARIQCIQGSVVLQRRHSPFSLQMDRTWLDYQFGFGGQDITAEIWGGLHIAYLLLMQNQYGLRVDVTLQDNSRKWAEYQTLQLSSELDNYRLEVNSPYAGNMGDFLRCGDDGTGVINGMSFSAKNRDTDVDEQNNCAVLYSSGWWYRGCSLTNLNANFYLEGQGRWSRARAGEAISFLECNVKWHYFLTYTQMLLVPNLQVRPTNAPAVGFPTTDRTTSRDRSITRTTPQALQSTVTNPCLGQQTGVFELTDVIDQRTNTITKIQCEKGSIVLQRRQLPYALDMNRDWIDYQYGFGDFQDMTGEIWLGIETTSRLVEASNYKLRVEVTLQNGTFRWGEHETFKIGTKATNYQLNISGLSTGQMGDTFRCGYDERDPINLMHFSSRDKNNALNPFTFKPENSKFNCANSQSLKAGWWYNGCYVTNFNVNYQTSSKGSSDQTSEPGRYIAYFDCLYNWHFNLRSTKLLMVPN